MQMLFVLTMVLQSVRSINEEVRWLQFVQRFQTQLNINSSIDSLPMCTTWISNNYQSTSALDRTLENIEKWGKHCISKFDCISGHISFQNQGLSVTEQLDAGVRRLVLELHFVPGLKKNLRLCASLQGAPSLLILIYVVYHLSQNSGIHRISILILFSDQFISLGNPIIWRSDCTKYWKFAIFMSIKDHFWAYVYWLYLYKETSSYQ